MPKVFNSLLQQVPADAINVGKGTPYDTPFFIGKHGSRDECVDKYREWLLTKPELIAQARQELTGKNLVHVCAPKRCHADVLVELVNQQRVSIGPRKTRPYQETGISFFLRGKRRMNCDEPGLGKTFQASEAAYRANKWPVHVFTPSHLVGQWAKFLQEQYPDTHVMYSLSTSQYIRQHALNQHADWYVSGLEQLRTILDVKSATFMYKFPKAPTLIFDESHHLKNRDSKQAHGALALCSQPHVENVYLLTATPVLREFDDMYQQLRLLAPNVFTSYQTFLDVYCSKSNDVMQMANTQELRDILNGFIIKRDYPEVGMYLPEVVPEIISVTMNKHTRKVYDKLRDDFSLEAQDMESIPYYWAMQVMQTLRQLTATNEKIEATVNLAQDIPRPAIFCWYKSSAERIAQALGVTPITGDIPAKDRSAIANASAIPVLTISSMSEGVDMSDRHSVIFFEEDYSPGTNHQALSRVVRYGFKEGQPLLTYCVHVADTIDEAVHAKSDARNTAQDIMREVLK